MRRPVDVHAVERIPPDLVAVERRFDALFARLQRARAELAAGGAPELEEASRELDRLCREMAALPAEAVRVLEPRLLALVHEVRALFAATARALRETGDELGRSLRRAEAVRAYARTAGGRR